MIAVDTNLLVYSVRENVPEHRRARDVIASLAAGSEDWAIPWPCVHEFLGVVTNPRLFHTPMPMKLAVAAVDGWRGADNIVFLGEIEGYWAVLVTFLEEGRTRGAQVHDARIAALCRSHGVRELWTADRDFSRFPSLRCRNPLRD